MFPAILITWVLHLTFIKAQRQNPPCSPVLTILPIDAPYYRYFPYFVELHRCNGACSVTPSILSCSSKTVSDYRVYALHTQTFERKTITLKNHTSCECSCVQKSSDCDPELESWNEDQCSCICNDKDSPPVPCKDNLEWDGNQCKCICNRPPDICGDNQEWSNEVCGCVCKDRVVKLCVAQRKYLDSEKCKCVETLPETLPTTGKRTASDGLDRRVFIAALLVEFLLLVIGFDIFLYFKYKWGVIYFLLNKKCCAPRHQERRNGQHPSIPEPKTKTPINL